MEMEVATWSLGINTDGKVSSSGVVWCRVETVVGVILVSVLEDVSSDNMGNNEFSEGVSSPKEGTSLIKFPIAEEERVVFLLYHMNITPRLIMHMPTVISMGQNKFGR